MESEGWKRLSGMARGRGQHAYRALELIAAYAYGKPSQPITGPDDGPIQLAVSALVADIQREADKVLAERLGGVSPHALAGGNGQSAEAEDT